MSVDGVESVERGSDLVGVGSETALVFGVWSEEEEGATEDVSSFPSVFS